MDGWPPGRQGYLGSGDSCLGPACHGTPCPSSQRRTSRFGSAAGIPPDADRWRRLLAGVDPDAIDLAGSNVPIDLEDETTTQLRPRTSRGNVIDTLDDENDPDYVRDDKNDDEAADDDDDSVDFRVTALNELQDVFQKLTPQQRDAFSSDDIVKWKLLNLDSIKVYTTYDLKDVKVLKCGAAFPVRTPSETKR